MTLFELLFFVLTVGGVLVGIVLGAEHTWWWAVLGAPLGAGAGILAYFAILSPVMLIGFGPRKFFSEMLPRKRR